MTYYFFEGIYYRRAGRDYVVVTAPRGAVISDLPLCDTTIYDGDIYYYYKNVVYARSGDGYIVVDEPDFDADTFKINIENSDNTITQIIIRRSGDGYVGPQGEYYYKFPKVSHLKGVYGKD